MSTKFELYMREQTEPVPAGHAVPWDSEKWIDAVGVPPEPDNSLMEAVAEVAANCTPPLKDRINWYAMRAAPPLVDDGSAAQIGAHDLRLRPLSGRGQAKGRRQLRDRPHGICQGATGSGGLLPA